MSYQNMFVLFDIHSKYILQINKGSEKQTFINMRLREVQKCQEEH